MTVLQRFAAQRAASIEALQSSCLKHISLCCASTGTLLSGSRFSSSLQHQQLQQQHSQPAHKQHAVLFNLQQQAPHLHQQQQQDGCSPSALTHSSHLLQLVQQQPLRWHCTISKALSSCAGRFNSSSSSSSLGRSPQLLPSPPAAALARPFGANFQQPHQLQQQQGLRQLIPHHLAPKPLPRFRKPSKDGRLNRMVIRIPPQVQVDLQGQQLTLTGKAGSTSLSLPFLDPTGLVAWQCHSQSSAAAAAGPGSGSLLLLVSPSKRCWRGIQTHIYNAVHGVMQGYLVGLTVQGVGYRMEPVPDATIAAAIAARRGTTEDDASSSSGGGGGSSKRRILWETEAEKTNIAYPHKAPAKAVRLKVGYTRACIFQLPEGVLAFFVKPTLMYLYGIDKALVTNTAAAIRAVRKPNPYTGNGIQLVGEVIKLKQRAGSK